MPTPTNARGAKLSAHTTTKRSISGPGRDWPAAIAERDDAAVRQTRAREARSASRSPDSSINSRTEYRAFRTPVCMARSASERGRELAPGGTAAEPYRRWEDEESPSVGRGRLRSRTFLAAVPLSQPERRESVSTSIVPSSPVVADNTPPLDMTASMSLATLLRRGARWRPPHGVRRSDGVFRLVLGLLVRRAAPGWKIAAHKPRSASAVRDLFSFIDIAVASRYCRYLLLVGYFAVSVREEASLLLCR
mmetsp:Transcript_5496/g.15989  ORF Transcript_5496/g.15989 Transcript_5496/m.15989 type:complete len:249 (+) Transcript_5496:1132-1878(+)